MMIFFMLILMMKIFYAHFNDDEDDDEDSEVFYNDEGICDDIEWDGVITDNGYIIEGDGDCDGVTTVWSNRSGIK